MLFFLSILFTRGIENHSQLLHNHTRKTEKNSRDEIKSKVAKEKILQTLQDHLDKSIFKHTKGSYGKMSINKTTDYTSKNPIQNQMFRVTSK